jgi:diacylglycerol kinase (ATP)
MRAAAILGLNSDERDLEPFRLAANVEWCIGLPDAATPADAILILGGDGTIHRHLKPLVQRGAPVLVVPQGSGNDFARALGIRSRADSLAAWRKFAAGGNNVTQIDLGLILALPAGAAPAPPATRHYFCCVGGCGLDAEAGRRANTMPGWLRAHGGYVLSLLGALARFRPVLMKISLPPNGKPGEVEPRSSGPAMLLAFANAPAYGGGMRIAPKAQLDDGKLDFCLVKQVGKLRLSWLFPTVYFGRHLKIPEVEYFQAERVRLETGSPMDVYADGEFVCRTPVEVTVAPRALRVILPGLQGSGFWRPRREAAPGN